MDDTVKIAHSDSVWGTIKHGLFTNIVYPGMVELLQEMNLFSPKEDSSLIFVTNSPTVLLPLRKKFLSKYPFPPHQLFLRNYFEYGSAQVYKAEVISKLLSKTDLNYILIGDDTEADMKAYHQVWKKHKKQVLAVYIHRVTGNEIFQEQRSFFTAYDLALQEYQSGRLNIESLKKIAKVVMDSMNQEGAILPPFFKCSKNYQNSLLVHKKIPPSFKGGHKKLISALSAHCEGALKSKY